MPGAWQALANMADEAHWDAAYRSKKPTEVSWYEASPDHSLRLIGRLCSSSARIIDVGGGASLLVDALLDAGYQRPIVLDVSASALDISKLRLGARAAQVEWIVGDITKIDVLPAVDLSARSRPPAFPDEPSRSARLCALGLRHRARRRLFRRGNLCAGGAATLQRSAGPATRRS